MITINSYYISEVLCRDVEVRESAMFGYVKTYTPELKVGEYEYYRGAYCGLCRAMGKCTGQCSRMTLSYDFAFLALIRVALSGENVDFHRKRCFVHPLHKRKVMKKNPQLEYCAYAAALLSYHKLSDDISDERGKKKLLALISRPMVSTMRRRAIKKGGLAELDRIISEKLAELSDFERSQEASVDTPADIFGDLLSKIVSFGFEGTQLKIAENIGSHVGRWIYITDAADDFFEDVKKQRYNPFALLYGNNITEREKGLIADALKNELCDAEMAVDLIEFEDRRMLEGIIRNIFYLGMPHTVKTVLTAEDKETKNSRKDNLN